jgi:hypothetical protein
MKMSNKVTKISKEELEQIVTSRAKLSEVTSKLEALEKEVRIMGLEYRILVQNVYLTNKLEAGCQINQETGVVTWPEDEPEVLEEAVAEIEKRQSAEGEKAE